MGNTELRFLKERVQMRVKGGMAGSITKDGKEFASTTSTSWVDIGMVKKGRIKVLPAIKLNEKTKLRKFLESVKKHKVSLIQIANLASNFLK